MTALPAPFEALEPRPVWAHFSTFCRIPRPSKKEAALRETLAAWAAGRGLAHEVDAAGNLLIRKPAAAGCERAPVIALQAHLDMVGQRRDGSTHDFERDPIVPVIEDGWVKAEETTLGADNGMGAALMLAVLEDTTLRHGALEALFTVDEEAGMGGAMGLQPGWLKASRMLNLDTEVQGEFYVGCAGGIDVHVTRPGRAEPVPADWAPLRITLGGLRGGHSGVDIHEGRGNAIKLLVRVLDSLADDGPWALTGLEGGTARNALPRSAWADVAVPASQRQVLEARLKRLEGELREEWDSSEPGLTLSCAALPGPAGPALTTAECMAWLGALRASPHGVHRMSPDLPGVVETSNNLGVVSVGPQGGSVNFMVRSLRDRSSRDLARDIEALWRLHGSTVTQEGHYPGWTPRRDSALLGRCQAVHLALTGQPSRVQVIHAGLECGLLSATFPDMDIVSFGPTIRGAHAPGEAVEIASVAHCWELLRAILEDLTSA